MNTRSRIYSILQTGNISEKISGLNSFNLSQLNLPSNLDFDLPDNIRLGHLAEKVVSELIKASSNFKILHENVQIMEGKSTVGEIDFLVEEIASKVVIHLELAYKFYLFDPSISSNAMNSWIGPNRNDSLVEKLNKLKEKQFPLLHHPSARSQLVELEISEVSQSLCMLTSLYLPYQFEGKIDVEYSKGIRGYYLDFESFASLHHSAKAYYVPDKKEWGIHPGDHGDWSDYDELEEHIKLSLKEKRSVLCWQKEGSNYSEFFIVWW